MDNLKQYKKSQATFASVVVITISAITLGSYIVLSQIAGLPTIVAIIITFIIVLALGLVAGNTLSKTSGQAISAVWQAVFHISPGEPNVAAPNLDELKHGRELASSLINQIYTNLTPLHAPTTATIAPNAPSQAPMVTQTPGIDILEKLPLPILVLDKNQQIIEANELAKEYLFLVSNGLIGKSINDAMSLSFRGSDTLENWLENAKNNLATATNTWNRVRLQLPDEKGFKQFDLMAQYTKNEPSGRETLLAIFDRTEQYNNEDESAAYVAMAVHELRTPVTLLRGYIEVFEEELDNSLTPELRNFMHKMSASAQTLTAFVSNILNVARVDENSLVLSLHEANWNELLSQICSDLELRARVRNKTIELDITPNLPSVAVDKVSIYEVMSNLIDNAIKYSEDDSKITVHSGVGKDGNVETIVQDRGEGIPAGALKHLFTKFYRSHRSKGKVGGSGLGLYLVKAIITAHGGQVWVSSREGEGSSFGFTLQLYSNLAAEIKDAPGGNIDREAHGWIKNHSMYRR